ncbi:hypothetical protein THASP1DRAFT_29043 [Thamnocephalis sphaerospora]|uniref:Uncharacterized protein n=1 Tax=Thamnocephalis sphaerospora TaxID=78915 RepID=A0A4P9XSQ1_9FUNG|nr:hypothetical protein THASP1DRAFT_29043 [Thamnocephalis sphaerospora]|eukprot:RKP09163.1 hypothetical protein THASP1DRAFT_29043 [Thamnocephalis sphaerospora]
MLLSRLSHDEIHHLCYLLDDCSLVLLAAASRYTYHLIAERPVYWEQRYRREFQLDDWRERSWLVWFNEQMGQAPTLADLAVRMDGALTLRSEYLSLDENLQATHWYHAYHRRRLTMRNLQQGSCRMDTCALPVANDAQLYLSGMNAWASVIREQNTTRMWALRHNTERSGGLQWRALELPPALGQLTQIAYADSTSHFVVAWAHIRLPTVLLDSGNTAQEAAAGADAPGSTASDDVIAPANTDNSASIIPADIDANEQGDHGVILAWPNTGADPPLVIFMQSEEEVRRKHEIAASLGMYGEWVLMRTPIYACTTNANMLPTSAEDVVREVPEIECYRYDVYDLERMRHCTGVIGEIGHSYAHLQAVSMNHVDMLVFRWVRVTADHLLPGIEHPVLNTPGATAVEPDKQDCAALLRVDWELHEFRVDREHATLLRCDTVHLPSWPNAQIEVQEYGPGLVCVMVYNPSDGQIHSGEKSNHAQLSLFVVGDTPSCGAPLQAAATKARQERRALWTRPVATVIFTPLYSEQLVIIQRFCWFNVHSAIDGTLLRQFACEAYNQFVPVLGPICTLYDCPNQVSWLADMQLGKMHSPPAAWLTEPVQVTRAAQVTEPSQDGAASSLAQIEMVRYDSKYRVSYSNVVSLNATGGQIRLYHLTQL